MTNILLDVRLRKAIATLLVFTSMCFVFSFFPSNAGAEDGDIVITEEDIELYNQHDIVFEALYNEFEDGILRTTDDVNRLVQILESNDIAYYDVNSYI
ncbi:MAG: hypothetical protein ACQEV7_11395 [Bacillota bacterium]